MITFSWRSIILAGLLLCLPMACPVIAADIYTYHDENGTRYFTNKPEPGSTKVRFPLLIKRNSPSARAVPIDMKMQDYESLIIQAGKTHAVDPDLVRAVIKVESNFNNRAVSSKGASGLMQLMPETARELGVNDPFEPAANIHGGVLYLSRLLDTLGGDLPLSLAAYNAGLERVMRKKEIPAIRETRNYVKRVLYYYTMFKSY